MHGPMHDPGHLARRKPVSTMTAMPRDYDSDPGRFLASSDVPTDDVHPAVAARLAAAGARMVLDVGGGSGKLARLLPGLSMRCLLIDLSPTMVALAPRPAARADAARLPVANASVDAVAALYTLYHFDDPLLPIAEARRVLRPGGLFAACAPNRDSNPELARVLPDWGSSSPFDGEDAPAIVASVFSDPGDVVEVDRWDAPLLTLSAAEEAAAFLRVHGMSDAAAHQASATLDLPITLTMRGCFVYATKAREPLP
jgi:SAM-dependent methyltransferase